MTIGAGVIGYGFMGKAHGAAYTLAAQDGCDCALLAICDLRGADAAAASGGNLEAASSQAQALDVKQIRSGIGQPETMRRTLRALGLRKHQQVVRVQNSPAVHGMLTKVRHLVTVAPVKET